MNVTWDPVLRWPPVPNPSAQSIGNTLSHFGDQSFRIAASLTGRGPGSERELHSRAHEMKVAPRHRTRTHNDRRPEQSDRPLIERDIARFEPRGAKGKLAHDALEDDHRPAPFCASLERRDLNGVRRAETAAAHRRRLRAAYDLLGTAKKAR